MIGDRFRSSVLLGFAIVSASHPHRGRTTPSELDNYCKTCVALHRKVAAGVWFMLFMLPGPGAAQQSVHLLSVGMVRTINFCTPDLDANRTLPHCHRMSVATEWVKLSIVCVWDADSWPAYLHVVPVRVNVYCNRIEQYTAHCSKHHVHAHICTLSICTLPWWHSGPVGHKLSA